MKAELTVAVAILTTAAPASAHRLDEYLQATLISVEKDRVQAQMRLTPGVAVFPVVLADIDTNQDGVISETEQRTYAERVLGDLSLTIDGDRLTPQLISIEVPALEEMKEGRGEIQLDFQAGLPPSAGPNRRIIFENHHQSTIAAYMVNCLVPRDPGIRVVAQNRNYSQSHYQLDYEQAGGLSGPLSAAWWSGVRGWVGMAGLLLFTRLALRWRLASASGGMRRTSTR